MVIAANYILYDPSELDKCEATMDRSECLETVLELQRARIAELEAALKPFADISYVLEETDSGTIYEWALDCDDLRAARAAYLGTKNG